MWWTGLLNHRASSGVLEAGPSVPRTRTVGLTRVSQRCLNHLLAALLCCPAALSPFVSVTLVAEGDHNVALLRGVQQGWLTLLTKLTVLAEFIATEPHRITELHIRVFFPIRLQITKRFLFFFLFIDVCKQAGFPCVLEGARAQVLAPQN